MLVHIAKTNGVLYSGEADSLTAPGSEGEVTILTHHTPLASILRPGHITVKKGGTVVFEHDVEQGVLEVTPESATVLL
jgi:F-type H+-transporting ATPase subunit epsilon